MKVTKMDALVSLWLAGGAQGMLLCAVILAFSSANPIANRWLALFVGLRSLHLLMLWLTYGRFELSRGPLGGLLGGPLTLVSVLAPPALYLYVRTLTEAEHRRDPRLPLHLLVLVPPLLWYSYHASSTESWATAAAAEIQSWPSTAFVSVWLCFVTIPYCVMALRLLDAHGRRLEQALSSIERVSLQWLRWLVVAMIASHCVHLALDLLQLAGLTGPRPTMLATLTITLVSLYIISIGGLRQPQVFTQPMQQVLTAMGPPAPATTAATADEEQASRGKYAKSSLGDDRRSDLWLQLQRLLEESRPYLNPDLNLPELARLLGVRPQELSEVINSQNQGSFYELINWHRVQAAIRLLDEDRDRQRKIMDIGFSAGFRNQSTFYQHFRKITGMAPAAYRDQLGAADTNNVTSPT
jgi:AraC-like DNA-binding protein